ncbi:hypothetical protein Ctha_1905 [Chloroherpeton thalassium ATCC 35110]|uniref:Thioredoxin domain-containing protein n=1 Tax=Chloroherpeton thalassium (strain ATCC 35110 / GB-78) TaxID=517418 RepID=B3QUB0_CHLT3|nr:hypothetical protein [Chloroherpeton thalassium]ACF14359.1 hypothetical protein Ctha_1905 [Chloroherpeton thalassium ATCC 35110]
MKPLQRLLAIVLFLGLILPKMDLRAQTKNAIGKTFPEITGYALNGTETTLPNDANGFVTVIILAFEKDSQDKVDTWADTLIATYDTEKQIRYFELPMISGFYSFMSGVINGGMRSGVPKPLHGNVVTFYGDREKYTKALGIPDMENCYLFVLDKTGVVRYTEKGYSDFPRIDRLFMEIDKLLNEPAPAEKSPAVSQE